jgi:hypothetical protein
MTSNEVLLFDGFQSEKECQVLFHCVVHRLPLRHKPAFCHSINNKQALFLSQRLDQPYHGKEMNFLPGGDFCR